jgi:hypothetical protein
MPALVVKRRFARGSSARPDRHVVDQARPADPRGDKEARIAIVGFEGLQGVGIA